MSKQTERFIKGAFILSLGGMVAKVASSFFKIPLVWFTGDEGSGYYQSVYSVYIVIISAGMIGIPNALSKLIAEESEHGNYVKAHQTFRISMMISVIYGLLMSLLMFLGTDILINLGNWPRNTLYTIYGLSLAPVFVMISGAIKGYFQGVQQMKPSAVSLIVENFGKFVFGIALTWILIENQFSIAKAVGGAALGTSLSAVLAAVFMGAIYIQKKKKKILIVPDQLPKIGKKEFLVELKRILFLTIPVTIASSVFAYMNMIDTFTVFHGLEKVGIYKDEANDMMGQIGKLTSIMNFPQTISLAIVISIIPAIAQVVAQKNQEELQKKVNQGIKFATMLTFPAAVGLIVLADPIIRFLFPTHPEGTIYLQHLGFCLVFVTLGSTVSGILQGLSKQFLPIISLMVAVVVKLILNNLLIPTKLMASGATLSSIVYLFIFFTINYILLKRQIPFKLDKLNVVIKPLLGSVVMGVAVYFGYDLVHSFISSNAISTLLTIGFGALLYLLVLFITKGFNREEFSMLPKNQKFISFLEKKQYFD